MAKVLNVTLVFNLPVSYDNIYHTVCFNQSSHNSTTQHKPDIRAQHRVHSHVRGRVQKFLFLTCIIYSTILSSIRDTGTFPLMTDNCLLKFLLMFLVTDPAFAGVIFFLCEGFFLGGVGGGCGALLYGFHKRHLKWLSSSCNNLSGSVFLMLKILGGAA